MKNKYWRCPVCDKLILFKDEIIDHCFQKHGESPEYLRGYQDAIKNISNTVTSELKPIYEK